MTKPTKPILIGMNNPLSQASGHELYPMPEGCAGNRLWKMLDEAHCAKYNKRMFPSEYLRAFDRRNLVHSRVYCAKEAKLAAHHVRSTLAGGKFRVVLLGAAVRTAFGYGRNVLSPLKRYVTSSVDQNERGEMLSTCVEWFSIPHPSGRCRDYNDQITREEVGKLLLRLYEESNS